jgi:hypothetical protein
VNDGPDGEIYCRQVHIYSAGDGYIFTVHYSFTAAVNSANNTWTLHCKGWALWGDILQASTHLQCCGLAHIYSAANGFTFTVLWMGTHLQCCRWGHIYSAVADWWTFRMLGMSTYLKCCERVQIYSVWMHRYTLTVQQTDEHVQCCI